MLLKLAEEKQLALRARVAALEQQVARAREEIAMVNEEIAKLDQFIELGRSLETEIIPSTSQPRAKHDVADEETGGHPEIKEPTLHLDERFRHKSYKSAACLVLEMAGKPMSVLDITEKLIEVGIEFVAKDPSRSVFSAITAAAKDGYVRRASTGLWELVPASERQSEIQAKQVNSRELSENTRLALARAKERGVQLGRREKITEEQRALVIKMISEGASVAATARAVGFSVMGLTKWISRHDIRRVGKGANTPEPEAA